MGELDCKPFQIAAKRKFNDKVAGPEEMDAKRGCKGETPGQRVAARRRYEGQTADEKALKAVEWCSIWETYISDSSWYPFKVIPWEGRHKEVIDEEDEQLKNLKEELGAVLVAIHIKRQSRSRRLTDEALHKNHMEKFCDWFRSYVAHMDDARKQQLSDKIKWLARGPNTEAKRFKRFVVNGFKFRVKNSEETKKTQNSGVCVPVEGGNMYYGVVQDIVELNYFDKMRYVLFKCDWADVNTSRGHKIDEYGFVLVNFSRLIHTGEQLNDEPFILASQASQVYYVKDPRDKGWVVAVRTKARDVFDVGNGEREEDDVDTYYDNEPYELIVEDIHADGNDNLDWSRSDATGSTLSEPLTCEGQLIDESDSDSDFDV
ncbi:hypothetical protein Vadar_033456 [Vaccinium darrowii]|uniref:Uncharacterized protein n=1 Tax=Vaccinium darrowii TaxID=229202 RepID=A0ACB7ZGS6_9ERIC|nr:hypothetical protein Vadar_033456 [Vaccinium darrowii]